MRRPTTTFWSALLTVLVLAACSADTASAPGQDDAAETPMLGSMSNEEQQRLQEWEQREKDRVRRERELSEPLYDSLKTEWDRLRKELEDDDSRLLLCEPLQYAADVKIIGPGGGSLSIGPHKLVIPRGALSSYAVITGELPVSNAVSVRFSPEGLRFALPPKLTLSYKHCGQPPTSLERVAYTTDDLQIVEYPLSVDRILEDAVDAWIWHFSKYAVAY